MRWFFRVAEPDGQNRDRQPSMKPEFTDVFKTKFPRTTPKWL